MDRDRIKVVQFHQTAFRYADYDTPFWSRNNRTAGRWHSVGDGATQYLARHPDGAWAELIRRENLREEEVGLVRIRMWAATLSEGGLVDYSTFERAEAAGFPPEALIDDDYTRSQEEGLKLRRAGYAGVIAASAALPGEVNVTLFGRRVLAMWGYLPRLASSAPACVVAVGGPPPGVASRTRHVGTAHAGYEMYIERRAEDERAAQLDVPRTEVGDAAGDNDAEPGERDTGS